MNTVYNQTISDKLTSDYLNTLVNKVFALLPMFEESFVSNEKAVVFETYQRNLLQTINGNVNLLNYNSQMTLDILSHLQALNNTLNHSDYKRHVFKTCTLLNLLKREVDNNGL